MAKEVIVILDRSHDSQALFEQQRVNFYQELQHELSSRLVLMRQIGLLALPGSRVIVKVISVTIGLIGVLISVILCVLSMITTPNRLQTWIDKETETLYSDGSRTFNRKRVLSSNEQLLSEPQVETPKVTKPSSFAFATGIDEE
jgi:hypothetical protein